MISFVIFDLDGVLVETEPQTFQFYQDYLEKFDIRLKDEDFSKKAGRKSVDFFRAVLTKEQAESINIPQLIALKRRCFLEEMSRYISKVSGARELLEDLKGQGLRLALASQNEKLMIEKILDWLDIRTYFEVVLSLQDIEQKKPAPQIYRLAAVRLNADPAECLVVEDSLDGILAAKAAGMRCVALRHPYTPPDHLVQADGVVDNLASIAEMVR